MRAAERLNMSPANRQWPDRATGAKPRQSLFTLQGRRLSLTEAGRMALKLCRPDFPAGEQLQDAGK